MTADNCGVDFYVMGTGFTWETQNKEKSVGCINERMGFYDGKI